MSEVTDQTQAALSLTTIPRLLEQSAEYYAGQTAIEDGETTLSFGDLATAAQHAARAYIAVGVQPGDRIAIWAPNIHEWVVAALGLHSVGAVLVPINTRFKGAEAGYVLKKSQARMLLTVEGFLNNHYVGMLREAMGGEGSKHPVADLPDLQRVVVLRGEIPTDTCSWQDFLALGESTSVDEAIGRAGAVKPDDLSDILFTSGTTGQPKGVMTTHEQNLRAFASWTEVIGLRKGDRYLIVNPFFHAFGYKAGWLSAIMRGATIIPHPVFDAGQVLERIGRDKVTMLPGPPSLYQAFLANEHLKDHDLSSLRLAVTGGAVIPVELIHRMKRDLGFETIITGYGLTEACGIATMCRYDDDPETIAVTSGRAIDDVEVRIVDDANNEVPRGEPGEIIVRGYNLMQGYFDDEEQTKETIDQDGWLHTGDIGIMNAGGYIRITDRKKDMFIMGGFNCYPAEIESLMLANESYVQVAVVGVPDERKGEVGMAFVIPSPNAELSSESVIEWCRTHIANYKVPRYVEIIDQLPMNATGKVQKFILRERAQSILDKPG